MLIPQTGRVVLAPASFGQERHRRQPAHPCQWRSRHPLPGVRRVERSARFYRDVLGGEAVRTWEPSIVALANSWDVSVSSDGRDLYVPDATNSQIASFSIGARAQLKPAGHPQLLPAGSAGIAAS